MALKFNVLTRPEIRAMKIGASKAEHGIIAERQKSGDIRYRVNVMVDGKRIHRVVGRESDGVTREQAERLIEKLRTDARSDRLDLPEGRKLHRSFAQGATDYLAALESTDGRDMVNKRRHLTMYLVPYFGVQRIDQIKEFAVKQYRRKRTDAGAAEATVNRELSTLSHFMKMAAKWGWIDGKKIPAIEKRREPRKQIRVLSDEQAEALMTAAKADQDGRAWLFVAFGLGSAMRHSEIMRVRYDDIDFATRRIWINKAKAGEREQPITPALAEALAHQQAMEDDQTGYVFPATRKGLRPYRRDMRDPFARSVVRAGMDPAKVTPHVMRHTAITRLVQAKVDIPTIQKISGHKTVGMVLHYTHVHSVHIDNALASINQGFLDPITHELHTAPDEGEGEDAEVVAIKEAKSAA